MIEFLSTSLWVALVGGLTWVMFYLLSLFCSTVSHPAKVTLLIPVVALNIVVASKIVEYVKALVML